MPFHPPSWPQEADPPSGLSLLAAIAFSLHDRVERMPHKLDREHLRGPGGERVEFLLKWHRYPRR